MSLRHLACAPVALAVDAGGGALLEDSPEAIVARAAARARDAGVPYAGLVTPEEAQCLAASGARIVDVRMRPEWELVGHVPGSVLGEWQKLSGRRAQRAVPNPKFPPSLPGRLS
jgi:hypothetical protein